MANEEQLSILKQGVEVWNEWRAENIQIDIDLSRAVLIFADFRSADFSRANLSGAHLSEAKLLETNFKEANLLGTHLDRANLMRANLCRANLKGANLKKANLSRTDLSRSIVFEADFREAILSETVLFSADISSTNFGSVDLSRVIGLDEVRHRGPSTLGTDTLALSKGKIPEAFLRGCGLSDWEIEEVKLYNPDLSNEEINRVLYKMYDLRATQALQISPLFISYSHGDRIFVDKLESQLNAKGIRFWRDIHDMKAGRIETQIDRAINQNRTVLLILSEHSIKSDWVEHEVRTARGLEKDMGRDVLCPVALDDSWKSSPWPKRVMEQIMEYNILDFSAWEDDSKFDDMFRKLIDGLELFYKDKSHGE